MLTRIHRKLGTAGFTIAIVALIAALGGTALAASGALSGKQKKEVEKIAKKFAGKPGAPGAPGPAGPAGTNGTNGKDGAAGTAGKDGVSPVGTAFTGAQHGCAEGGIKYEGATTNYVCNGEEGSPWTAGGTLPSGQTLTGHWAGSSWGEAQSEGFFVAPVSYALPRGTFNGAHVEFFKEGQEPGVGSHCTGNATNPGATAGYLCVFTAEEANTGGALSISVIQSDSSGFLVASTNAAKGPVYALGTWAVNAE